MHAFVGSIACFLILPIVVSGQSDVRTFKVLVAPAEPLLDSTARMTTDVEAHIGHLRYAVRGVEALTRGVGRSVIVLDFGATSSPIHACLLAEALVAIQRLDEFPAPILIAAGSAPDVTSKVTFGPGDEFVVSAGGDLESLRGRCQAGGERYWGLYSWKRGVGILASLYSFTALANSFTFKDGPVRVFWLSEYYRWFDFRSPTCGSPDGFDPCPESDNAAVRHLEAISESNLTLFPIVFGEYRRGQLQEPLRLQMSEANYMAHYLGGFATKVSGTIGDTLVRVFEATRHAALVSLEGPVTTGKKPRVLAVSRTGGKAVLDWRRPFVVNREGSDRRDPGWALTPLVLPSANLVLGFGCRLSDEAGQRSLKLTLPPEVMSAPPGKIEVYLSYQNESGLAKQRLTIDRTSDPSAPLCIQMIHARDGMKFSIVVRDRSTGWIGATDGTLVDGDQNR